MHIGDNVAGDKTGGVFNVWTTAEPPPAAPVSRRVILLLSANPDRQRPLRLDEERREIDQAIASSRGRDRLDVRTADAVRLNDLPDALLRHEPVIVQFSGHGHADDGIQVTDNRGWPRSAPPAALSDLFRILPNPPQCVVLNACHSEAQAQAIAVHVPYVIGMRRQILDETAILFAAGFYRGIADGQSVRTSFELARNRLDLHGVPDRDTPQLIGSPGDRPPPVPLT